MPKNLITNGKLEKLKESTYDGIGENQTVLASWLGYRITDNLISHYFGRVFDNPATTINKKMLTSEAQFFDVYVDCIKNLTAAKRKSTLNCLKDGTIKYACPLLKIVLRIMVHGDHNGRSIRNTIGTGRDSF